MTLAEAMKEKGFTTAAVISAYVLHHQYGLAQGFDHYDDSLSTGRREGSAGFEEMEASYYIQVKALVEELL